MSVESLSSIRGRMLPMLEVAADQYRHRVPRGYPHVIDTPEQGVIGLEIDSSHALFVTSDGDGLFAEIYRRAPRTDNRAGAGRQKPAGVPFNDRRPLGADATDQDLRNLIADLMSYFNQQPGLLFITDD
ncbi:MAG: hypothetical protein ACR2GI_01910 [Thermomicrobiales bacterium]|nr:hypothetical protein [Chloroflexia bacterium]